MRPEGWTHQHEHACTQIGAAIYWAARYCGTNPWVLQWDREDRKAREPA